MLSKLAFFSSLLLASAALADTSSQLEARRRNNHQSRTTTGTQPHIQSVDNFGAVWYRPASASSPPTSEGHFTTITGTFQVPYLQGDGASGTAAAIAIDGIGCQNYAGLQVGVDMLKVDGVQIYYAWCGWSNTDTTCDFTSLNIQAGDIVTLSLNASSLTTAMVTIQLGGQIINKQIIAPDYPLCWFNVGWIVRSAFTILSIPATNFGLVNFTDAVASLPYIGGFTPEDVAVVDVDPHFVAFGLNINTYQTGVSIQYIPPHKQ